MNRAKIILGFIAIMAIIGSAYAYKTTRGAIVYCSIVSSNHCTLSKINVTITPLAPGVLSYCTDVYDDPCTTRTLLTPLI